MLNHVGTQTLYTKRLVLRRFEMGDVMDMYGNWAGDVIVTRYLTWLPHPDAEVTRRVVRQWVDGYREPDFYQWAVQEMEGPVIGSISFFDISEEPAKCETGYCLSRCCWGRGYMTEALTEIVRFGLETVGFERIQALHDVRNPASGRVMAKSGMQREGLLRRYVKNGLGEIVDVEIYAAVSRQARAGRRWKEE